MKCTSFITLLTGLGALTLQFIALFGGYNTTTLPNLYMFQVRNPNFVYQVLLTSTRSTSQRLQIQNSITPKGTDAIA